MKSTTKKKIKKFFNSKGGVVAIITTAFLCLGGLLGMLFGYVYGDLGGDWSRLGELFRADWFIGMVVLLGVLAFLLVYLMILLHRKEERY